MKKERSGETPSSSLLDLFDILEKRPFALTESVSNAVRLAAVNAVAFERGLNTGDAHADARAAVPDLLSEPIDRAADARARSVTGLWLERFSPAVSLDGCDAWRLDASGVPHLFGGEDAYAETVRNAFENLGFSARVALAETYGVASSLARFGPASVAVVPAGGLEDALRPLPIEALRIGEKTALQLRRLGLKTVGALADLPRLSLARRFRGVLSGDDGEALVRRLDEALGRREEPMRPLRRPPAFAARRSFLEPVLHVAPIEAVLPDLAEALAEDLAEAGRAAAELRLGAHLVDGRVSEIAVSARAGTRDPRQMVRLLKEKLEGLEAGFGIEALVLAAPRAPETEARQKGLDGRDAEGAAAAALDRMAARLGEASVFRLARRDAWLPERAQTPAAPDAPSEPWETPPPTPAAGPMRPPLLLPRPEPVEVLADVPDGPPARFVWRRVARRVAKAAGPERIEPPWFETPGTAPRPRDYYRVEDEEGRRYWLFREGLYERSPHVAGAALFSSVRDPRSPDPPREGAAPGPQTPEAPPEPPVAAGMSGGKTVEDFLRSSRRKPGPPATGSGNVEEGPGFRRDDRTEQEIRWFVHGVFS